MLYKWVLFGDYGEHLFTLHKNSPENQFIFYAKTPVFGLTLAYRLWYTMGAIERANQHRPVFSGRRFISLNKIKVSNTTTE
jgi:hypothetical protein